MITALRANNFRSFRHLELLGLRRVNVIVGKNASGKTALLEATRLALTGTPGALWGLNQLRSQLVFVPQPPTREQFEAVWSSYFYGFDPAKVIQTECTDLQGRTASVRIFFDPTQSVTTVPLTSPQPQLQQQPPQSIATIVPLVFDRVEFSGRRSTLLASVNAQGAFQLDPGVELSSVLDVPFHYASSPQQTAQWFSQLAVRQSEKPIVEAVREAFSSDIEDLMVLIPNQIPSIYAKLRYLNDRIPLTLVSAGVTRFVALLAALSLRTGGVVLIDEIENGFFYKSLPSLWRYLLRFAQEHDTQVFTSTHSQECVRALGEAMIGQEDNFALLRTEHVESSTTVKLLEGNTLEAAIEQGVEIR